MSVKDKYSKSRATKKSSSIGVNISAKQQKKVAKTIKKSPLLTLAIIFLIVGAVGGFFAYKTLSLFAMNTFTINGVASAENDYVIVDLMEIKSSYLQANPTAKMEDVYASITLHDNSVNCKFFGMDKTDTITIKYFYREDISHDAKQVEGIDVKTPGVYYVEYTSSFFAFKNSTLIRTIIVTEVENDG